MCTHRALLIGLGLGSDYLGQQGAGVEGQQLLERQLTACEHLLCGDVEASQDDLLVGFRAEDVGAVCDDAVELSDMAQEVGSEVFQCGFVDEQDVAVGDADLEDLRQRDGLVRVAKPLDDLDQGGQVRFVNRVGRGAKRGIHLEGIRGGLEHRGHASSF